MINTNSCMSRNTPAGLDLEKWQKMVDLMSTLYDSACGTIVQYRQSEFNAVVTSQNEDNFLQRNSSWPWDMQSFCRHIIESGERLYVQDAQNNSYWKAAPPVDEGPVRSYLGLPVFWPNGELFGTICAIDTKTTNYDLTLQELLEQFRDMVCADLKILYDYETLRNIALTDELTGLNNRRGLMLLAEQRLKDARRFEQNIGMAYLDLDNLKQVNDRFGHQAGDHALTEFARVLQESSRETDIIARLGGDIFIAISLTRDEDFTMSFCAQVTDAYTRAIQGNPYVDIIGVSFGFKLFPYSGNMQLLDMMDEVDALMYQHKQNVKKATPAKSSG